jgi:hypothetical protein
MLLLVVVVVVVVVVVKQLQLQDAGYRLQLTGLLRW